MSISRVPLSSIENKVRPQKSTNDGYKLKKTSKWPPSSTKFDELRGIINSFVSDCTVAARANSIIDQLQHQFGNQHNWGNEETQSPKKNEIQIQTVLKTVQNQSLSANDDVRVDPLIWHDPLPSGNSYWAEDHSNDEVIDSELSQAPEVISVPELKTSVRRSNRRASVSSLSILQNLSKDSTVKEKKPRPRTTKKTVEFEVRDNMTIKDLEIERPCISPNKSPKTHETASPTRIFEDYPLPWISEEAHETLPTIEEDEISEQLCAASQSDSYPVLVDSPAVPISTSLFGILKNENENKWDEVQSTSPFGLYTISMSALSIAEESTADQLKTSQILDVNVDCDQNLDSASPLLNLQGEGDNLNYESMLDMFNPLNQSSPSSSVGSLARNRDSNDDLVSSGTVSVAYPENPAFPSRRRGRKPKSEETSSTSSRRKSMRLARPSRFMMEEEDHLEMELEIPTVNALLEGKAISSDSLEGMKTRGRKDNICKILENVVMNSNDSALEVFESESDISEKPKKSKQARGKKDKVFVSDVPRENPSIALIPEFSENYLESNTGRIDVDNMLLEPPIADKHIVDSLGQLIFIDDDLDRHLNSTYFQQEIVEVMAKDDESLHETGVVLEETAALELRGCGLVEDLDKENTNLVYGEVDNMSEEVKENQEDQMINETKEVDVVKTDEGGEEGGITKNAYELDRKLSSSEPNVTCPLDENNVIRQSQDEFCFDRLHSDDVINDDAANLFDNADLDVSSHAIYSGFMSQYQMNTLDSHVDNEAGAPIVGIPLEAHDDNDQSYQDSLSWCSGSNLVDNGTTFSSIDNTKVPPSLSTPSESNEILPMMQSNDISNESDMHKQEDVDVQDDMIIENRTDDVDPLLFALGRDEELASASYGITGESNEDPAYYGIASPEKDMMVDGRLSLDSCSDSIETVICNRQKSSKPSSRINPAPITFPDILHASTPFHQEEMLVMNQDGVPSSLIEEEDKLTLQGCAIEETVEGLGMEEMVEIVVNASSMEVSLILDAFDATELKPNSQLPTMDSEIETIVNIAPTVGLEIASVESETYEERIYKLVMESSSTKSLQNASELMSSLDRSLSLLSTPSSSTKSTCGIGFATVYVSLLSTALNSSSVSIEDSDSTSVSSFQNIKSCSSSSHLPASFTTALLNTIQYLSPSVDLDAVYSTDQNGSCSNKKGEKKVSFCDIDGSSVSPPGKDCSWKPALCTSRRLYSLIDQIDRLVATILAEDATSTTGHSLLDNALLCCQVLSSSSSAAFMSTAMYQSLSVCLPPRDLIAVAGLFLSELSTIKRLQLVSLSSLLPGKRTVLRHRTAWMTTAILRAQLRWLLDPPPAQLTVADPSALPPSQASRCEIYKKVTLTDAEALSSSGKKKRRKSDVSQVVDHTSLVPSEMTLSALLTHALRQIYDAYALAHSSVNKDEVDLPLNLSRNPDPTKALTAAVSEMMENNDRGGVLDFDILVPLENIKHSQPLLVLGAERARAFLVDLLTVPAVYEGISQEEELSHIIQESALSLSQHGMEEDRHLCLLSGGWKGLLKFVQNRLINTETETVCEQFMDSVKKPGKGRQMAVDADIMLLYDSFIFNFPQIVTNPI